jgi:2-dehydro-3-deoxygluconokinase
VLHALRRGEPIGRAATDGLALTCLKHSLPGDASLFGPADLADFIVGGLDVRR